MKILGEVRDSVIVLAIGNILAELSALSAASVIHTSTNSQAADV